LEKVLAAGLVALNDIWTFMLSPCYIIH